MIRAGTILGDKYEIVEPIAGGGMGVVYRARNIAIGKEVAVKVLLANFALKESLQQRFRQEAYVQGQLEHPNIIPVTDFVAHAGTAAIVMGLVPGPSLEDVLERERPGPWPLEEVMPLMQAVTSAVGFAHARGIDRPGWGHLPYLYYARPVQRRPASDLVQAHQELGVCLGALDLVA